LVDGPIVPTLVAFSLPLLTTNFLHSLAGTWGAIWVSHVLGPDALTAVVNANVFMFMMMGAVMGVGTAAGIAVGQSMGSGDNLSVKRIAGTSVSFVLAVSGVFALAGYVFAPGIIELMQMPAGARDPALTFLRVTCFSMPPIFTFLFLSMLMRGAGDARTPFRFSLLWISLGLVLSPVLLTGSFGFPRLGIAGVALGNLCASVISLTCLVIFIYVRRLPLALRGEDLHHLRPDPSLLGVLIRNGTPMALETLIVQGAYFLLLSMVNGYGSATAAAYSGAAQLWGYVQMPAIALAASMSAMAAQNIGAGRWDRVEEIALKGCVVSGAFTLAMTGVIYLLGDWPLMLFLPQGGTALETAREINVIALWGWIVLSVTSGLSAIVRANAAMLAPTMIFAVTMWIFRVPFAAALQPVMKASAIWWSFPVGSISSAILAFAYYRWGGWRRNRPILSTVHDPIPVPEADDHSDEQKGRDL
jgi:putative MATE family efflux protein